jgi:hypothetical protein
MFSSAGLSLAAGKMRRNKLVTGGFRYVFTESQAASCQHFQRQSRRFMVFKEGYWMDFQNKSLISKQQALIFSSTKKQKLYRKYILLLKALKNDIYRDIIPFKQMPQMKNLLKVSNSVGNEARQCGTYYVRHRNYRVHNRYLNRTN